LDLTLVRDLTPGQRVLFILLLAILATLLVRALRRAGEWLLTPRGAGTWILPRRHPKFVTLTTLGVSASTFAIYFGAFGLILQEMGISLTAYLASASVIGLAVAFGSQGMVQDVVTSLTLIFSDVLAVGDVVDIAGQAGRVEAIGLRFTTLVNALDQKILVPNRNINQINRYQDGGIRAFVDVQVPEGVDSSRVIEAVESTGRGMFEQFSTIILEAPRVLGVAETGPGGWKFIRLEFRLWPGQGPLIETRFVQRTLAAMRSMDPDYPDWKVSVTYRAPR
jgi:moderate conductance mechanosensitive channel